MGARDTDTEYGSSDGGLFADVDRGAPLSPWLEAVAYRRSARPARLNPDGTPVPVVSPYGTGGSPAA